MKKSIAAAMIAATVGFGGTSVVHADGYDYNAQLSTEFFPGSGNSNTNFAINTVSYAGQSLELAIKAKKRSGPEGSVPSYAEGSYSVQPGSQVGTPNRWWWNFDYSLNLGDLDVESLQVDFVIGFDSASGNADVAEQVVRTKLGADILSLDFGPTDSTPGWDGTDGLIQNSSNLAFGDVNPGGNTFDMNAVGTYTITINIYDSAQRTNDPIGSVTMQTVVVPLPGAAGLALAGMGMIGLRRRR